jgi:hypothetical protein
VERGEKELSPPLPHLHPPHRHLPRISARGELPPPPRARPHSCLNDTLKLLPLPSCLLPFILGMVGLPPHRILRQGNPSRGAVHAPKTLHKNVYALKKRKLAQADKSELEQTHLGSGDPFP